MTCCHVSLLHLNEYFILLTFEGCFKQAGPLPRGRDLPELKYRLAVYPARIHRNGQQLCPAFLSTAMKVQPKHLVEEECGRGVDRDCEEYVSPKETESPDGYFSKAYKSE